MLEFIEQILINKIVAIIIIDVKRDLCQSTLGEIVKGHSSLIDG